ncbi:MAG: tRNA (N(6)-L-threonylcarbamoyladenosine(37)-C(2))-methylthiotransferase MtaB [Sphingomonadaceae bacterium]
MTIDVINFGCRLNIAEGEAIRQATESQSDLVIINSCAVTLEAERQARQAIRRAATTRPSARIIVTGCAAQIDPTRWSAIPGVSGVIGNREKRNATAYDGAGSVADIFATSPRPTPVVSGAAHARAFIEIQTGCDHRCTFCIIPFGRGNSASASPDAIVAAIQAVVAKGQHEVILTGVDLTSYEGGLAPLVRHILDAVPDLPRLRLSSLDPAEVDAPLFDLLVGETRIMPHVHLSLQAGDDMILKRMKRRHSRSQAIDLVKRLKAERPEIAVGADLIAGFPTETDTMAANSRAIIDDCDIVFAHIFPYSPRPGTPATRMPQVPPAIAKMRAADLRTAAADRKARWLKTLIGTTQQVLVERSGTSGHAANFALVHFEPRTPGAIATVRIIGSDGERLTGVPA